MKAFKYKWCVIIFGVIIFSQSAHAYDAEIAHRYINRNAVLSKNSELNTFLKESLGFVDGLKTKFNGKEIEIWIEEAGTSEDYPEYRSFRHFHDPLKEWDDAGLLSPAYMSAVYWAQTPDPGTGYDLFNEYSWWGARNDYYRALTTGSADDYAKTFRSLGQLMHLVSDAASPAHVRKDPHIPVIDGDAYEKFVAGDIEQKTYGTFTTVRSDGSGEIRISAENDPFPYKTSPCWSKDGKLLAFEGGNGTDFKDIVVLDLSSEQQYPDNILSVIDTTVTDQAVDQMPDFSPAGRKIAFVRWTGKVEGDRVVEIDRMKVAVYNLDTNGWTTFEDTEEPVFLSNPKWSPNGDRIVYYTFRDGDDGISYMINANGSGKATLFNEWCNDCPQNYYPNWSPNGEKIVFVSDRDDIGGPLDIWEMNVANGAYKKIFDGGSSNCLGPTYSPGGGRIAFVRYETNRLHTVDSSGGNLTLVANKNEIILSPSWSSAYIWE